MPRTVDLTLTPAELRRGDVVVDITPTDDVPSTLARKLLAGLTVTQVAGARPKAKRHTHRTIEFDGDVRVTVPDTAAIAARRDVETYGERADFRRDRLLDTARSGIAEHCGGWDAIHGCSDILMNGDGQTITSPEAFLNLAEWSIGKVVTRAATTAWWRELRRNMDAAVECGGYASEDDAIVAAIEETVKDARRAIETRDGRNSSHDGHRFVGECRWDGAVAFLRNFVPVGYISGGALSNYHDAQRDADTYGRAKYTGQKTPQ